MASTYIQKKFVAPSLPLPSAEYSQPQQDQFQNALRLYFNLLDAYLANFSTPNGGANLAFPHIAASDTTDQYAGGDNTPTLVAWNQGESINGFTLAAGAATAGYSGVYKITYSLQLVNTDNVAHDVSVWLKVNGTNVARSATIFTVPARKSAGVYSYICAYSEAVFSVNVGDDIELYWATDKAYNSTGPIDGVYIEYIPVQTSPYARPAIPSAIGSITFVSAITT